MRFTFDDFALDDDRRALLKGGGAVHLSLKAYELLKLLLVERPRVLPKTELHERLWPDTFVSDSRLASVMAEVRCALGERARRSRFIRTAHGFGYGFVGAVAEDKPGRQVGADTHGRARGQSAAEAALLECWLSKGEEQFALHVGENVIGRGRQATVSVDSLSVSRRHARIVVTTNEARLEDLNSRNGTRIRERRIAGRIRLRDGDVVQTGSVAFVFHMVAADASTVPVDRDGASTRRK